MRSTSSGAPVVRFLTSQAAGQAADAATALVIARVVLTDDGGVVDARSLLATLAATTVPYVVVGPVAGVVADRWDRRRALGAVHLLRAVLTLGAVAAVAFDDRRLGLLSAACLLGAARLVHNLRAASLPWVAPDGRLVRIDARSLGLGMCAVMAGGAIGGVGATRFPVTALVSAAILQCTAAVGFGTMGHDLGGRSGRTYVPWRRVARRVAGLVTSSPTRFVVVVTTSVRFLLGATFATFVLLAGNSGLGADGYVLALAVTGAGSFAGAILAPHAHRRLGVSTVVAGSYGVPALALSTAGFVDRRLVLEVAIFGSFLAFQLVRVVADATVQASISDESRGRVFAVYDVGYNLSYLAGAAAAVAARTADRPGSSFALIGILAAIAMAVIVAVRRSLRPDRSAPSGDRPTVVVPMDRRPTLRSTP